MDPISITTGVLTLLGHSISAIQTCQSYASKYNLADLSIAAIRTECSTIRLALLQIQSLLCRESEHDISDLFKDYVLEEYNAVLGACSLTFALLNERLDNLGLSKMNNRNEIEMRSKLRMLWSESQMDIIRQNIRGQAIAISLLLTAFQSETITETYRIMKSQETKKALASISKDSNSLREASVLPKATKALDDHSAESIIGDEEFSFDDIIINSKAYRRAFQQQQKKFKECDISENKEEERAETKNENLGEFDEKDLRTLSREPRERLLQEYDPFGDDEPRIFQENDDPFADDSHVIPRNNPVSPAPTSVVKDSNDWDAIFKGLQPTVNPTVVALEVVTVPTPKVEEVHDWDTIFRSLDSPQTKPINSPEAPVTARTSKVEEVHDWDAIFKSLDLPQTKPINSPEVMTSEDLILKRLMDFGYRKKHALAALKKCDNNLERAANYLADQS